ncbi:methyltransferase domain-containing protein [Corallococcus llansteffanensis]|uniref:Methyltransferase domain-containing protein n=1 Tax=Corallococcus llansteffanensis TaxID=2316731 RepID=A0A3A8Q7R7_9BACT|nr:methyltransferase domain-containing protein [Corallococcus llansteffanensis]RKH59284.1 methyltransferase domain-containing protein [Corallococcus llansteffanensis]
MTPGDVGLLACPSCRGALTWEGRTRAGRLDEGRLGCDGCGADWPVVEGLPRLFEEGQVRGTDRLMRVLYDGLPALHDPLVTLLMPLLQGDTEARLRGHYIRRLELGTLTPRPRGPPLRVLEVGIGAGANLPLLEQELPPGLDVEVWGLDLSAGMLGRCRRRVEREGRRGVRLLMADAHALPFPDHSFDRVFEVGGINGYRAPERALAEMARVARPGTPVVVVDEQLDARERALHHRLAFRLLTFYTKDAHCPRELLPATAVDVLAEQFCRYYFCLTFRMPAARPARSGRGRAGAASFHR